MIYKIFIILAFNTLNLLCYAQSATMPYRISALSGSSFIRIVDCDCEFEPPKHNLRNWFHSVSLSIRIHTRGHLVVTPSIGYFNSKNTRTYIFHNSPSKYYNISEYDHKNFTSHIDFGIDIGKRKIHFIPNIGFIYFRRVEIKELKTTYYYSNLQHPSSDLPDSAPDDFETNVKASNRRWNATGLVIGLNYTFQITERFFLMASFQNILIPPNNGNWHQGETKGFAFTKLSVEIGYHIGRKKIEPEVKDKE